MKISELANNCSLAEARLSALAALCSLGTPSEGGTELTDEEACALGVALFLEDAGLPEGELAAYFSSDDATRRCILRRLRAALLEQAHTAQKRIDKVDWLLRKLETKSPAIKGG